MAVNSLATVTLPDRKTGIIQTKSIRDQRLVPQHVMVVVKIESYMCTVLFKGKTENLLMENERRNYRAYFLVG